MLKVHHLVRSQSQRIVWLCEELEIPYDLVIHLRDPATNLPAGGLKAVHPLGLAPVIEDGALVLSESGAIVEYLIDRHGQGRLRPSPEHPDRAQFLHWFHFANANLQAGFGRTMFFERAGVPRDNPIHTMLRARLAASLAYMDVRLAEVPYLAGETFTAADIMAAVTLGTMRTHARTLACAAGCIATPRVPRIAARSSGATPDLNRCWIEPHCADMRYELADDERLPDAG